MKTIRSASAIALWLVMLTAVPAEAPAAAAPPAVRLNDSHLHFVNFVQETTSIGALLEAMDSLGIEHTMLTGVPVVKKWDLTSPVRPEYYLSDDAPAYWYSATDVIVARAVQNLPPAQRKRVHPFLCGFNPTDRNAIDHVKRLWSWYPDVWEGIGEIFLRHDSLSAYTYGGPVAADCPALDPVYEFAAENDLPVTLHQNVGSDWLTEPIYLPELERAVSRHPKTRFIWAHAGIARGINVPGLPDICRNLLRKYPNVWIDLTSHLYELYLVRDGKVDPEWVRLWEEFPDRFMVGSDRLGFFDEHYRQLVTRNYLLLAAMTPGTRDRIARTNFLSILPERVRRALVP